MEKLSFKLDAFEGPIDLLLHLITKNKVNIYDIPISIILKQYLEYIKTMEAQNLDVTADFLAMAAQLIYIKSQMLLPKHETQEEEEDPRDRLVRLLVEYKKFKETAAILGEMSSPYYHCFVKAPSVVQFDLSYKGKHQKEELAQAYLQMLKRSSRKLPPPVNSFSGILNKVFVSVSTKVVFVLRKLIKNKNMPFHALFQGSKSRSEVVATFLAVLELSKENKIKITEDHNGQAQIAVNR